MPQSSQSCAVRETEARSEDLTRINGLGPDSVMNILSEIGPDLSHFANVKHFCSWLGLAPATKISGGKVLVSHTKGSANQARQTFRMAAMALSRSDSALKRRAAALGFLIYPVRSAS